jgi:hypothetical protein
MLHGYANPLKRLDTSESVNLHKCLILLDSCLIHATRRWPFPNRGVWLLSGLSYQGHLMRCPCIHPLPTIQGNGQSSRQNTTVILGERGADHLQAADH